MSAPTETHEMYDEPLEDEGPGLPARRRRRSINRWTVALLTVLVAGAGFIGGVEVQKHQGGTAQTAATGGFGASAAAGARGGFGAAGGSAPSGGAAPAGGVTAGTISDKRGGVLYVKTSDGTVVRVRTTSSSKITRNAAASARGLYPGDTVLVQGSASSSGTVTATRVTATSSSAAGSGGGFFRGGGGFAGPPGAGG